ncbi:PIN domain-containing protein [Brevundimonas sp. UBA7534]|uniref:PIN domain-containing protein n=1 Tax=Brevundimonas sp. UBA7534 TaxID=1946138 RepID=UPI001F5D1943|nr:PIN domain-containing protein [Brevundimonas sp. UBA7534]
MLDTSVAIHLRDGDGGVRDRILTLNSTPVLSIITQIELEGGVVGADATIRRQRLDRMFAVMPILPFVADDVERYRAIIATKGFSRRKTMDRLIAAQAIRANATLVTLNGDDFRDIPGLTLLEW